MTIEQVYGLGMLIAATFLYVRVRKQEYLLSKSKTDLDVAQALGHELEMKNRTITILKTDMKAKEEIREELAKQLREYEAVFCSIKDLVQAQEKQWAEEKR